MFHITHFPFLSSNIPSSPAYDVLISHLWNAKLTETRIFRELSIEIESSLIELLSSVIELKSA